GAQPAEHRRHRRGRDLHLDRQHGGGHRTAALAETVDRLDVVLDRPGRLISLVEHSYEPRRDRGCAKSQSEMRTYPPPPDSPRNSVLPRPGGYDGALPARSSATWSGGPTISARRAVVPAPRRSALDNRPPERQTGPAGDGRSDAEVDVDADRSKQEDKHAAGLEPATRGVDRPDQHGNQGQLDESEDCSECERQSQRSQGQHPHDHYPGDEEQPLGVHEGVQGDPEPVVQQSEDQEGITEPESPEDAEYAGDGALADRSRPDRRDGQAKSG